MEEYIVWSQEEYTVADLLLNKDRFPILIRMDGESEPYYAGAAGAAAPVVDPRPNVIYRVHQGAAKPHLRAVCMSEDGIMYSIPLDSPLKFYMVNSDQPMKSPTRGTPCRHLMELVRAHEDRIPFDVAMDPGGAHKFRIGAETRTHIGLGKLTVIDIIAEDFIKTTVIKRGFVSKSVVVLAVTVEGKFRVAEGVDESRGPPGPPYPWDVYRGALSAIAKNIDFSHASPKYDILQYEEPVYVCTHRRPRPPTISNSEENEKLYEQLKLTTFATLMRTSRTSGDACISKKIHDMSKANDEMYGTVRGVTQLAAAPTPSQLQRRGSEGSVPQYSPTLNRGRSLYGQGARAPGKGPLRRSVVRRHPPAGLPVGGCCEACQDRPEYMCMHNALRGNRSSREGIYQEIRDNDMDVRVSAAIRSNGGSSSSARGSSGNGEGWNSQTSTRGSSGSQTSTRGSSGSQTSTRGSSGSPTGRPVFDTGTYITPALLSGARPRAYSSPEATQLPARTEMSLPPPPSKKELDAMQSPELPPAPPPPSAHRHTVSDGYVSLNEVPGDISDLTQADILRCLQLLNLSHFSGKFNENMVDGDLLKDLTVEQLEKSFQMNPVEAKRLFIFANKRNK